MVSGVGCQVSAQLLAAEVGGLIERETNEPNIERQSVNIEVMNSIHITFSDRINWIDRISYTKQKNPDNLVSPV
jgi:hypothetical protein